MIEIKDQRTVKEQIKDNIESAEKSLFVALNLISDREDYKKLMDIIGKVRELKNKFN